MSSPSESPAPNPWLKIGLEIGPLVLFFALNSQAGLMTATGGFMAATVISLVLSYFLLGKIPFMPLISGAFIMVFGALTLILDDEMFIKIKPTLINTLFGCTLLIAQLFFHKSLLRTVMGEMMAMTDTGWRILTIRWGLFFLVLAGLNEGVWRLFDTDTWVNFKVFGLMPLTLLFTMSQLPVMMRHALDKDDDNPLDQV